uniref:Uncharacterized protein n=1 Tax=Panagrolaimus sp. PS1159 TaxID=55785 RepID=A0AC35GZC3_9BILA
MGIYDVIDLTKKLHEKYSFTNGWLLNSLREKDEIFKNLYGYNGVKDITAYDVSDGKGFVSIVLRCTVFFVDIEETYATILKIPGSDSLVEASDKSDYGDSWLTEDMRQGLTEMHQFECDFYNEIAPLLDAPIPKVFKTEPWILDKFDGCVHMEDLTNRGKSLSYFDCINLTQIKSFVRHLAKMHKNILSAEQKLWKGKYLKGADCFGKFLSVLEGTYEPFLQKCKLESK